MPPIIPGYTPVSLDFKGKPLAARQAEARALLAQAGYGPKKPLKFELNHRAGLANKRVVIAVADMLKAIGVEASLLASDVTAHYNRLREGDFVFADAAWNGNYDPEYYTYMLLSGSTEINYGSYSNPAFDAKSLEASRTMDPAKRMQLFREAEQMALNDHAIIPIYIYVNRNLVQPYVKGWVENPIDFHPSRWLYIDKSGASASR
jgi:oligopeptide transport system substrate-binding protein